MLEMVYLKFEHIAGGERGKSGWGGGEVVKDGYGFIHSPREGEEVARIAGQAAQEREGIGEGR